MVGGGKFGGGSDAAAGDGVDGIGTVWICDVAEVCWGTGLATLLFSKRLPSWPLLAKGGKSDDFLGVVGLGVVFVTWVGVDGDTIDPPSEPWKIKVVFY